MGFAGYDWVIRVNPDVVIWDEKPLLQLMQPVSTWAVFANCGNTKCRIRCSSGLIHTDFFAVRPEKVNAHAFEVAFDHAERQATWAFRNIVSRGADAWLVPNGNGFRRIRRGGILHDHNTQRCGIPSLEN